MFEREVPGLEALAASAADPWLQDAWDWEAARVDGKLHRFGYCGDRVLVLVVVLHDPVHSPRR